MKRADTWWKIPEVFEEDRLLDFGAGGPPAASEFLCQSTYLTSDIRLLRAAEAVGRHDSYKLITDVDPEGPVDTVFYEPTQREAKLRVFEVMDGAFRALKPGGRLYLAGRKDRGVESYRNRMIDVFGRADLVGRAKRTRVFEATKTADLPRSDPADVYSSFSVSAANGNEITFRSRAGVFSADGLDPGSQVLVEAVLPEAGGRILDLGCGAGTIGILLAAQVNADHLTMVDVSALAAACASDNAARNGLADRTSVLNDDLYGALEDQTFDWIVSNPPFHEGNAVAHPLIEGAAERLSSGGCLALVVMRVEPYLKALTRVFSDTGILLQSQGYTVLTGRNPT